MYGSRSDSDEAPLSDSEDRDHAARDPDGMGGIGMELNGQVKRRCCFRYSSQKLKSLDCRVKSREEAVSSHSPLTEKRKQRPRCQTSKALRWVFQSRAPLHLVVTP